MKREKKLNKLFQIWPMHTALTTSWLGEHGFPRDSIKQYRASGWLVSIARGIVARPNDKIEWSGYLWPLQEKYAFHIGGKSALELQGKAHFIKFRETEIFLFSKQKLKLPAWLKQFSLVKFSQMSTNFLPENIGIKKYNFGEYTLKISNPARAFLEYMYLIGKKHSFEEAYLLMENLTSIDPSLMQAVLEKCTSIKVKRLVLCLAKKQNVPWFKDLDLSRIDIGSGVREIVKNGAYDSQFLITYPKSWDRKEYESIF